MEHTEPHRPEFTGVYGHIDRSLSTSRDDIFLSFGESHKANGRELLNPGIELSLDKHKGDAEMLSYILHEETKPGVATRSAYRGIVFAHMVLEELQHENTVTTLDEYWETSIGLTHGFIEERIYTDASSYIYDNQEINDMLAFFMQDLVTEHGYEHMVEIGAAMILRQAEIDSAINELVPTFKNQLNELPEYPV